MCQKIIQKTIDFINTGSFACCLYIYYTSKSSFKVPTVFIVSPRASIPSTSVSRKYGINLLALTLAVMSEVVNKVKRTSGIARMLNRARVDSALPADRGFSSIRGYSTNVYNERKHSETCHLKTFKTQTGLINYADKPES